MSSSAGHSETNALTLAKLEAILATAVNAIVTIDMRGLIESINPATTRLFGYEAHELVGRNVSVLMPEPYASRHDGYLESYLRTGTRRIIGIGRDVQGRHRDGRVFPIHLAVSEFEADGRRHFTGIITDLSERKRVEDELRASQERLQATLAVAQIGLWQWDPASGSTIDIEPAYAAIAGLPAGTTNLDTPQFLAMVHPEDRGRVEAAVDAATQGGSYDVDYRIVIPDGGTRWLHDIGFYFDAGAGRRLMRGATVDITARKEAEAALKESERRLAHSQKMEALGQLAGGIAHDFNNLLTVITGNQELLEMRLKDERSLQLLKRSQDAAGMGARLAARMLTFARRRRLEPVLIDLNEQIIGMVELLRRSIGEQVSLSTNLAPRLSKVRADPSEVENTILNLAINARDAMPGGGMLFIETTPCRLDGDEVAVPRKLPAGDYVRLSVSDTGVGMSPEVLARAFEPFFTTKPAGKGTGLGLSTIYGFVEQSGGAVTAYSEVGRGTTVNVYFPVAAGDAVVTAHQKTEPATAARGEAILSVEDNAQVREVTRERLEGLGYRVIEAESGVAARAILEAAKAAGSLPDLVLSDVVMPGGVTGFDLARWIRQEMPSVKVLLTSGYPGEVAGQESADLPGVRLLRKPYSRAELQRALRETFEG